MKEEILKLENITKTFGGLKALNNVSFSAKRGEITAVIGPNGAGKTTLFNVINGFYPPNQGRVIFKNQDITNKKPHQICRLGIARTFQIVKPLSKLNVLDNVIASAYLRLHNKKEVIEFSEEILEFCGLKDERHKLAKSLPLGMRKRLEIARALATKPELILLDEAFAGLNPYELNLSIELVRKIVQKNITVLIIEHHMKVIMELSDYIFVLDYGEKIAEGKPVEVSNNPIVIEAYLGESHA